MEYCSCELTLVFSIFYRFFYSFVLCLMISSTFKIPKSWNHEKIAACPSKINKKQPNNKVSLQPTEFPMSPPPKKAEKNKIRMKA